MNKLITLGVLLFLSVSVAAETDGSRIDLQINFRGDKKEVKQALNLKSNEASDRQVYLFENKKLEMYWNGIQIRLRIENGEYELGVKRWNISDEEFAHFESELMGRCEQDIHGPVITPACVIKILLDPKIAKKLLAGEVNLLSVLSREQLAILIHGPLPSPETLRSLLTLGPIQSEAWAWKKGGRKYSLDIQTVAGVSEPFMELSVKTEDEDPEDLHDEIVEWLEEKGLEVPYDQSGRRIEKLKALLRCDRLLAR